VFVDGSAATHRDQLVGCVLRDLRGAAPPEDDPLAVALDRIRDGGIELVVLDNLEQLGPQAVPVIDQLASQPVTVVYTSRVPLGARGEQILPVDPLGDVEDQVALFLGATPRVGPTIGPGDRTEVERILSGLDGLPLAIELAAGRLAVLSLDELAARMRVDPLDVLRDPARASDRYSTVWRSVGWSYELLPPPAADAFEQLASFAGPFDLELARAVVRTGEDPADALHILLAWHLLRPTDRRRFEWLASVRAFAEDRLARRPDREDILDRHDEAML
jgi:predicted ATPase